MYQQRIEHKKPCCIVILDRSESMQRPRANSGITLAHGAARAIKKVLLEVDLTPGARSFVFGAALESQVRFLSIGTRLHIGD